MRGCLIVLLVLFMVPLSLCAMVVRDASLWLVVLGCVVAIVALLAGRNSARGRSEAAEAMAKDRDD